MKKILGMLRKNSTIFLPLLAFPVLFFPYCIFNSKVLVKVFGCGCPKLDLETGMPVYGFNANNFTEIFWLVVAGAVVLATAIRTKKLEKRWEKLAFTALAAVVSLVVAYRFTRALLWL